MAACPRGAAGRRISDPYTDYTPFAAWRKGAGAGGFAGMPRKKKRPVSGRSCLAAKILSGFLGLFSVAAHETVDAAAGIHQLLLAGVERMALGADVHAHVLADGAGLKGLAAHAAHRGGAVLGMDVFLHRVHLLARNARIHGAQP